MVHLIMSITIIIISSISSSSSKTFHYSALNQCCHFELIKQRLPWQKKIIIEFIESFDDNAVMNCTSIIGQHLGLGEA